MGSGKGIIKRLNIKINTKKCSKCKIIKNTTEFHKHKTQKDGFASSCKDCEKIRTRLKWENKILASGDYSYCIICNKLIQGSNNYCQSRRCHEKAPLLEWTDELSILAGWIASDGCIEETKRRVQFTNGNLNLMDSFMLITNSERKPTKVIPKKESLITILH